MGRFQIKKDMKKTHVIKKKKVKVSQLEDAKFAGGKTC